MRKTVKLFSFLASFAFAGSLAPVMAQTAAATPAAAAATPTAVPTPAVTVDGLLDAGFTYNFANSSNHSLGAGNVGTFFDNQDSSYAVNLAEVDIKATQGAGTGYIALVSGANNGNLVLNPGVDILQAYVAYTGGLVTFTGGRFATWMGNEVIESKNNWNYSRSLLFWYTIPLWHNGLSVAYNTSDSKLGITGYATNGWNSSTTTFIAPDTNLGETYGLQVAYKPDSVLNLTLNGIVGPVLSSGYTFPVGYGLPNVSIPGTDDGNARYVGELIVAYNPNSTWSFALDGEYGGIDAGSMPATLNDGKTTTSTYSFWGVDLYAKYQIQSDWDLALRLEELKDSDGSLGLYGLAPQTLTAGTSPNDVEAREATLTVEHDLTNNFTLRLEGRLDMAYSGGTEFAPLTPTSTFAEGGPFAGGAGSQFTTSLGATYNF